MAQPNFPLLSQHLLGAGAEIALVPNLPAFNVDQHLNQINNQLQLLTGQIGLLTGQVGDLNDRVGALTGQVGDLNDRVGALTGQVEGMAAQVAQLGVAQDLLPMRLQNASSSANGQLCYPPGFAMVARAPVHKQDLLFMNMAACQATAQALGLPQLPGNAVIVQRRQQIIDYLGAALTA